MTKQWSNWARTETSRPVLTIAPRHVEHVQRTIERARETGHTVKPIGASHSFTAIGATDGIRVDMRHLRGLIDVDLERHRVTVGAGTHLWELSPMLDELGLALPNMGDIDRQTVSGATQTGTHGTGLAFGGLATGIVGMTLVTGTGEVLEVTDEDPELLSATALSLGALGIITSLTLQCVPAFLLEAHESSDSIDRVLTDYVERCENADHFEFYWFPHTKDVRTKTNTRIPGDAPLDPLTPVARWLDEELVNNVMLGAVLATERRFPGIVPRVNRAISTVSANRRYTDRSHQVFVTNRRVRFVETEFGVPLEAVPSVLKDIERMIERRRLKISFPIEVRNAQADSLMLSTAHGRRSGYVAVHRYHREDPREYFREIQAIMVAHEGRPHWGKMHTLDAQAFAQMYPHFEAFSSVRDRMDPDRIFTNAYLDRVLGSELSVK